METLLQIFAPMLVFVYHCFDRIVINGYLSMLSRPGQIVDFFHEIVGAPCISKDLLSKRTNDYNSWIESYAKNHGIPVEWDGKGVRKEDYVRPWLKDMERKEEIRRLFHLQEHVAGQHIPFGQTQVPHRMTRITVSLKGRAGRFTHYYFYIRDETLGPIAVRVASYLPFQVTCYLNGHNFIERELLRAGYAFRKNDNAFLSAEDPAVIQEAADRLTPEIITRQLDHWTWLGCYSNQLGHLASHLQAGFGRASIAKSST